MKKFWKSKINRRIFRSLKKIGVYLVLFSFLTSLWTISGTNAGFSDEEKSQENNLAAASLDALVTPLSFAYTAGEAPLEPGDVISKKINYENVGTLPFQYQVKYLSLEGNAFCEALILTAKKGSDIIYAGLPLKDFNTRDDSLILDLNNNDDWEFILELPTDPDKNLEEKTCNFNFEFIAWQMDLADEATGFHDEELADSGADIEIESGDWINPGDILINKVYYDVDNQHGDEEKNEWIELYNSTESPIDIAGWKIADNIGQDTLPSSSPIIIPSLAYAVITNDNTTWNYWQIPADVIKIELNNNIGNGLANSADMLVLEDTTGHIIDQMNWGAPGHSWANYAAYSAGIWEPGVADAAEGRMLGRVPTGLDTDSVSDWKNLSLPAVDLLYPVGGETWYVGQTYNLLWTASSTNGSSSDADLKIDLYYSNDSGQSWAAIVMDTDNDGSYSWRVPLFLDEGHYYVPSPTARVKVVATGPENFTVQAESSSADFCPPIDYDALSPEEQQLVNQLINEGVIDESEVIRGGVSTEDILDGMESSLESEINSADVLFSEEISMEAGNILLPVETAPENDETPDIPIETVPAAAEISEPLLTEEENNPTNIIPDEE